jgi:hypothetical protein
MTHSAPSGNCHARFHLSSRLLYLSPPARTSDTTFLLHMSTSNQITYPSTARFTAIFEAASNEYKTLTGQDLGTHPFGAALGDNSSPDAVLDVFRNQARAFDKCRKGDDKLIAWLTPMVHILITFSGTLGEGIGIVSISSFYVNYSPITYISKPFSPAKILFTGIGVLLGVSLFLRSLECSQTVFNSDREGCHCELRNACASVRAHSVFPPASQSLHGTSTHVRNDGVTRKDHGPDSFHPCAFD